MNKIPIGHTSFSWEKQETLPGCIDIDKKLTKIETKDDPDFDEEWYYLDEFGRRQGDYYSYYSRDGIYVETKEKYTNGVLTYSVEDDTNQLIKYKNYKNGILHGETRWEEPGYADSVNDVYIDGVIQGREMDSYKAPVPKHDYSKLKKYQDPTEISYFDAKGLKQGRCTRFNDTNGRRIIESECFFTDGIVDYMFRDIYGSNMFSDGERVK